MSIKKNTIMQKLKGVFVAFLMFVGMFTGVMLPGGTVNNVYADPDTTENVMIDEPTDNETTDSNTDNTDNTKSNTNNTDSNAVKVNGCKMSLGALGWVVCPLIEKISDAVDWLYDKIEGILVINPIEAKDGSPIYEIWKYCLGVANILFIIFLLVVIYSQITGWGITNYGLKKALPKLIVMAIMVNLSFLICALAVDVSNIIGNGLRGLFESVEIAAVGNTVSDASSMGVSMAEMYGAMAGGSALAIGAGALLIAFEPGVIWMLIPTVLGAVVAVATGLITIALRQAVVVLLVMISPLAFAANILPNTEGLFQKWKKLLIRMLVFYPLFSLLFGASSLAGFAIIMSAKDGFMLLLGVAVQIFPLFFSWKLMRMSGTFLGDINTKLRGLAARPMAASRGFADSQRQLSKQKKLAKSNPIMPSTRLMQFMSNRKIAREEELSEMTETVRLRGQAYAARRNYKKNGVPSKEGMENYRRQAENARYTGEIDRHKSNMNAGLGQLEVVKAKATKAEKAKLKQLDIANVEAFDNLRYEAERAAKIDYVNATGYYDRVKKAMYAKDDKDALDAGNTKHQMHGVLSDPVNLARYEKIKEVMEGREEDVGFIAAGAAHSFGSQSQIVKGKFSSYFSGVEATQDIVNEMDKLTKNAKAATYIDPIIAGLRTLNMRGDTNLVKDQIRQAMSYGDFGIGTHALQEIANFCMFDVKGNDPTLRRFGKYINMQTASMYNEDDPAKRRTRRDITEEEYLTGEYIDRNIDGSIKYEPDGVTPKIGYTTSKSAPVLLKGTSFKDMERTAIMTMEETIRDSSVDVSVDKDGNEIKTFSYKKFMENEKKIWNAIMPNVIGDHFSFLSGSEQIMAMSKGITGIDPKTHNIDWKGIFGEDIAKTLTPKQKEDYIKFLHDRTKEFLGGQVPSQIARTKSDMLTAIRNQYALLDAMENDEEFYDEMMKPGFKIEDKDYKQFELDHLEGVKKEFVESFKPDALRGFVKMHHKGYQGEAKDGLIQLLDPDALYKQYYPNGENGNRNRQRVKPDIDEDDDDGAPVDFDNLTDGGTGVVYNQARSSIDTVYDAYKGSRKMDVKGFWDEVKSVIRGSDEINSKEIIIEQFEERMSQYTDASVLYRDIMNDVFGGLSD